MHKALHPRDDRDGLYVSRNKRGRGLATIEDCVEATIQGLKEFTKKSKERLHMAANNSRCNIWTNRKTTKTRKQIWEEKQLYGHFERQIEEVAHEKTQTWLRKENLKRETESLIIAAQKNVITINYIKSKIDKT